MSDFIVWLFGTLLFSLGALAGWQACTENWESHLVKEHHAEWLSDEDGDASWQLIDVPPV